jgi:hypothetical protein
MLKIRQIFFQKNVFFLPAENRIFMLTPHNSPKYSILSLFVGELEKRPVVG